MEATMFYLIKVWGPSTEWIFVTESYEPLEFISQMDAENAARIISTAVFIENVGLKTPQGEAFSEDDDLFEFCENWDYPLATPFKVQIIECKVI